jgi:hypothetical protein
MPSGRNGLPNLKESESVGNRYLILNILIFTEGTIIMHPGGIGHNPEEIIGQVKGNEQSIHDWVSYVQIGNAVVKLEMWAAEGAEIIYVTSRTEPSEIKNVGEVLKKHSFPDGRLLYRQGNQQYKDIAEQVAPDILIEDDCRSIGGRDEMMITHVKLEIRRKIKSIPVKEFGGIDHLPDTINELYLYSKEGK